MYFIDTFLKDVWNHDGQSSQTGSLACSRVFQELGTETLSWMLFLFTLCWGNTDGPDRMYQMMICSVVICAGHRCSDMNIMQVPGTHYVIMNLVLLFCMGVHS